MIKSLIQSIRKLVPDFIWQIGVRWRHARNNHHRAASDRLCPKLWEVTQGNIASGPFMGLKYIQEAAGSSFLPKLTGTYEMELWPVFASIAERGASFDGVVDIGAAEGSYAIGLARMCPNACVVSYEIDSHARELQTELARRNGLSDRLQILGAADVASIEAKLTQFKRVLVVCDIEGAEKEILDPSLIPSLAVAEILVETHESKAPGIKQLLRERFSATHTIELYENRKRSAAVCPDVLRRHLSDDEAATAVWEDRGLVQHWMWMKPTNKGIEK